MNIYIITSRPNFFGRAKKGWQSLNLESVQTLFSTIGIAQVVNIDQLLLINFKPQDVLIISSDPDLIQLKYHIDVLEFIVERYNPFLFPNLSLLKAHENKGYQELLKIQLGLFSLNSHYLNSIESLDLYSISYPVVYKKITGAGSTGVVLAKTFEELKATIKKNIDVPLFERLKLIVRKFQYNSELYLQYKQSKMKVNPYILQPFVPNLKHDYKVLCFENKFYCLKRYVRYNDFRASGSGKFNFEKPPLSLVEYSKKIQAVFGTPVISLDICWDGEQYHLIEFQACHFGPSTLTKSSGYYQYENDWDYILGTSDYTTEFCNAYINYIKNVAEK